MKKLWQNIKALFQKSDVEKTSLQKTARISIIFAGIAIIGVIVYFAVVAPLLVPADEIVPDLASQAAGLMDTTLERADDDNIRKDSRREIYDKLAYLWKRLLRQLH